MGVGTLAWGPEKCLDQGAVGERPVGALDDHGLEHSFHGVEVLQLHVDIAQVGGGQVSRLRAGALPPVGKPQEPPDLVEGESEIPRPADKRQAFEVLQAVAPVAARAPARRGSSPMRS
jgi:hypothetical protein